MTSPSKLIPELTRWNDGKGITPDEWIFIEGRADHAVGFCSFLWPEFVKFQGYVFRTPFDVSHLRNWEGHGHTRQQIETAVNAFSLEGIFPNDATDRALKEKQCEHVIAIMVDMLKAKLAKDLPDRRFAVFELIGDDFGVSFHQV